MSVFSVRLSLSMFMWGLFSMLSCCFCVCVFISVCICVMLSW